ncbi:peptide chain release factor H [Aureibacter tunicatorum]|uniref:Peptide chain release factor n=1 Tax=Aureibacter tunicatorum TaxID=866807 RepID=A0AAE3XRU1_9BACT|nr:peptide chain release factor H [Aureibacter tunicatorum]MDR6241593.1 peptide chain release factor [Aureibacter tunicatorum]BDD07183.1 peptide chain release factor H [Aureibacter tunicatorum]
MKSNNIQEFRLQITSGRGPAECCWVTAQLLKYLIKLFESKNTECEVIHREKGPMNGTLNSAVLQVKGINIYDDAEFWNGTVQWIGRSQYRPLHKRKNWFVGVKCLTHDASENSLKDSDLHFQAIRSGGPGGQHANKVSSAVRITHKPTSIQVVASDQRSQHMNKKIAKERLQKLLEQQNKNQILELKMDDWLNHCQLERGNPIRIFEGRNFNIKK